MTTMFILFSLIFMFAYFKEAVSSDNRKREEATKKRAMKKQRKHTNIDIR